MTWIESPIVALNEAKAQLNITSTSYDAELTDYVGAASQAVANRIGLVVAQDVDEWHDGGSEQIVVRQGGPIQSVTSVTESFGSVVYTLTEVTVDSGSTGSAFSFSVDYERGVITRRTSGFATCFTSGKANVHVTYNAGYVDIPADIKHATLLLVQHMWTTQRGSSPRPSQGDPMVAVGFMFPARVLELLAPYMIPGIG